MSNEAERLYAQLDPGIHHGASRPHEALPFFDGCKRCCLIAIMSPMKRSTSQTRLGRHDIRLLLVRTMESVDDSDDDNEQVENRLLACIRQFLRIQRASRHTSAPNMNGNAQGFSENEHIWMMGLNRRNAVLNCIKDDGARRTVGNRHKYGG
uniref:Uncharacterized protein n=1 Tax=Mycena chlorophos TaxID=658473 RepID=A0ABQ0L3U8_MYCCL|nr:predicted protein [Mycena chlorophos]